MAASVCVDRVSLRYIVCTLSVESTRNVSPPDDAIIIKIVPRFAPISSAVPFQFKTEFRRGVSYFVEVIPVLASITRTKWLTVPRPSASTVASTNEPENQLTYLGNEALLITIIGGRRRH